MVALSMREVQTLSLSNAFKPTKQTWTSCHVDSAYDPAPHSKKHEQVPGQANPHPPTHTPVLF